MSVLGLLWGCKKEKVEPLEVNSGNPNSINGRYDQPKSAEITSDFFKFKRDFTYNSQGLVTNSILTIDTLKGTKGEKMHELKYEYQNDLVSKISYKFFPVSFLVFHEPEPDSEIEYVYVGSRIKHINIKNNIKIEKIEQYSYYYDLVGNVDYILIKTISHEITEFTDSVNYIYATNNNTQIVTQEEFKNISYFDPKGLTPKDTGSNGFVRFDRPIIYSFNDIEYGSENGIYTYSKLEKRLQKELEEQIIGYYGLTRTQFPVFSKFIKPYFPISRSEFNSESRNIAFEYLYKTNDKGLFLDFTPKQVGMPISINSFEQRRVKIAY